MQVARPAGLGSGAAEPFAAKGLGADDGADHRAVDIAVADAEPRENIPHGIVDPAVDAERQRVAGGGDLVERGIEPIGAPAYDMENRAEYFAVEPAGAVDLEGARREEGAVLDEIAATGYALTLGIHSRIDDTVRHVLARLGVGNSYVNRTMIGAVVGAQPFGGERRSGTGPKAGGPRYLHRFATERTLSVDTTAAGGNATLLSLDDEG